MMMQHKQTNDWLLESDQLGILQRELTAVMELHHKNIVEWFHTIETATVCSAWVLRRGKRSYATLKRENWFSKLKPK